MKALCWLFFLFACSLRACAGFRAALVRGQRRTVAAATSISADTLSGIEVKGVDGESIPLQDLLKGKRTVLACLTHFGDFNAWELMQNLQQDVDLLTADDTQVICIGVGSPAAAKKFATDLELDARLPLYADETASAAGALGCYRGWLAADEEHRARWPQGDVNSYVKLFGMIFGLGSPGTIGKVLYGYAGNSGAGPATRSWVVKALLQGSKKGRFPTLTEEAFAKTPPESGLRPFELATLRLQTGLHIVLNWGTLGPKNGDMFTRMGGVFVLVDGQPTYQHYDLGILTYAPRDELLAALAPSIPAPSASAPTAPAPVTPAPATPSAPAAPSAPAITPAQDLSVGTAYSAN
ncbi:hypothetical protein B484DRAFT_391408 [Ochromonadaceae sp. CCMP2298]|nr:hypothetical protein B484DRAFT_391408 [Ochromonadaceae sp. CCMP2298]